MASVETSELPDRGAADRSAGPQAPTPPPPPPRPPPDAAAPIPTSVAVLILSSQVLLRSLVGYHRHSGEGGHHGKSDAYGGDYEAQRHWMELTYHLPVGEWYTHDLAYWGLDYPPLTAYASYACGWLSDAIVGPETVALRDSRGYEDGTHKSFMRGTVLALDAAVYFAAVWAVARRLRPDNAAERAWIALIALTQPAVVLIDHGHFQYNTVALGLALWSFHFMTLDHFRCCVLGSVLFCLSLNFKQMSLYYAPAVFAYLLGRCFAADPSGGDGGGTGTRRRALGRFCALGATVVVTFAALWFPFVAYRSPHHSALQSVLIIVRRLFPFQRGLFEGKVSNLWCALSVRPVSIRQRVPPSLQPPLALFWTMFLAMPSCVAMFHVGSSGGAAAGRAASQSERRRHLRCVLWGTAGSALSFFLASFQVHEKSILLAVAPASVLASDRPLFVCWFSLASAWALWPLLTVDRLRIAYLSCVAIFCAVSVLYGRPLEEMRLCLRGGWQVREFLGRSGWVWITMATTVAVMVMLHVLECVMAVPESLPDLFPVLWSVVGCGMFCWSWLYCFGVLFIPPVDATRQGPAKGMKSE